MPFQQKGFHVLSSTDSLQPSLVTCEANIWQEADSLSANTIYGRIGRPADFLRGAYMSNGGIPIIALQSTAGKWVSRILEKSPEGVSLTAIAADPVVIVSEYGAFDPRGFSIGEHALGIAYLAEPEGREVTFITYREGYSENVDPSKKKNSRKPDMNTPFGV